MIIIDQDADLKLVGVVEKLRQESIDMRCLYIALNNRVAEKEAFKKQLLAMTEARIGAENPHLYFCADGDVVILSPTMRAKDARALIIDIATSLGKPASEDWIMLIELPLHTNRLQAALDEKLEVIRKAREAKQRAYEQQLAERKRHAILNGGTLAGAEDIRTRRAKRTHAELMIIEDDAFSRRLVENVLQKQFSLTGLGEADTALDTYTRLAPDVLFLDINLPDVSGHELLEKIIAMDPEAYVVMLSGNADRENITQALAKGAKGFIAKPFNREKIVQYLDRCPTLHH